MRAILIIIYYNIKCARYGHTGKHVYCFVVFVDEKIRLLYAYAYSLQSFKRIILYIYTYLCIS